jgi:hypothetical protein
MSDKPISQPTTAPLSLVKEWLEEGAIGDEWLHGFACALATIVRTFDQPTLCKSIMDGYGITPKMLRAAGVESFDLKQIRRAWK